MYDGERHIIGQLLQHWLKKLPKDPFILQKNKKENLTCSKIEGINLTAQFLMKIGTTEE